MTWDGTDRRKRAGADPITVDDLDEALAIHSIQEREYMREVLAELKAAFPNGDFRKHYDYHEQRNKVAQAEKEFWDTAKKAIITTGVSGVFSLLKIIITLIALGLTAQIAFPSWLSEIITKGKL